MFKRLERGESISEAKDCIPHIKSNVFQSKNYMNVSGSTSTSKEVSVLERQKERCWKALLEGATKKTELRSTSNDASLSCGKTEWDIVHDYFTASKSKKVLSIVQI